MIQIDDNDTPWEAACKIINATTMITNKCLINGKVIECEEPVFSTTDLIKLGRFLINYGETEECVEEV